MPPKQEISANYIGLKAIKRGAVVGSSGGGGGGSQGGLADKTHGRQKERQ